MVSAIKRFGFVVPVILQETVHSDWMALIDGELRHKAATQLKMPTMPAIIMPAGASDDYVKALRININRMAEAAEWNEDKLAVELRELEQLGTADLEKATGFSDEEVAGLLALGEDADEDDNEARLDRRARVGARTVAVPDPNVEFECVGSFDLPALRADRILDMPAPSTWAGTGVGSPIPPYMYNFSCDSTVGLDWKQTVVAFYTADHKFEVLWSRPDEYVSRFLERGLKRAVSPNWSVASFWPLPRRLFNVYRSRWIARYMQEAGMRVVPDFCGAAQDLEWLFDGLPGRSPLCIQIQGRYTKKELREELQMLEAICDFRPQRLWVYAPENRREMFPILQMKHKFPIEFIEPRLSVRKKHLEGF